MRAAKGSFVVGGGAASGTLTADSAVGLMANGRRLGGALGGPLLASRPRRRSLG